MPLPAIRYCEPPVGLVQATPEGLHVYEVSHEVYGPAVEDLVPIDVYATPLAWHAAIVREVARQAERDEARAVLAELDVDGALYAMSEGRRLGACSYARRLPVHVAEELIEQHREWLAAGRSTSILRAYPEAQGR
jgi:hypothetical protein